MKKHTKTLLILTSVLLFNKAYSTSIPNTDHPTTFLGPTVRGGFNGLLTDTSGYSFSAEGGGKDLRVGGSVGWSILERQRLKLSAEYLWQEIEYAFFSNNEHSWEDQGALGAAYEYDLAPMSRLNPALGLSGYYSASGSKSTGIQTGTFVNSSGTIESFTDNQHIASSRARGLSPGITVQPWKGTKAGLDVNYDNVQYQMENTSAMSVTGLGATAHVDQAVTEHVGLGLSASVRQPYNHYEANLGWKTDPHDGAWLFKLVGAYTIGKQGLPDTYNIGLSADYFLDMEHGSDKADQEKEAFLAWMAQPAVYMPEVLSVRDESVTTS